MSELMIRWYQFGCFSPIFRTHGCRLHGNPNADPDKTIAPCEPKQHSCGPNEVWSYGNATQIILEKYIRLRSTMLPYLQELSINVTKYGVPTVRPLFWNFPDDSNAVGINDEYLLGPYLLVAPVTIKGATARMVYFPFGCNWINIFDGSKVAGGQKIVVHAPLDVIPVFRMEGRLDDMFDF